jgi:hypothetical protein
VLAFVVPVKSPVITGDWARLSALFERTLRSICAQAGGDFSVHVVCNSAPDTRFTHPAVSYLTVDMPAPERDGREADKAHKLLLAYETVRRTAATHIMVVDADDCVSNRIASTVAGSPEAPGWSLTQGYVRREGAGFAWKNVQNFHHACGSTAIARVDLFESLFAPGPWYTFEKPPLPDGVSFASLPYPGAVYNILNGENIFLDASRISAHRRTEGRLQYYGRKARKYRPVPVTPRLRREFGLYELDDATASLVPPQRAASRSRQRSSH